MTREPIGNAPIPLITAPAAACTQAHDSNHHSDPDVLLVTRAKTGDKQAMAELFARHRRSLTNICCRVAGDEGEDALMEVMTGFPSRIRTYDPDRGLFAAWFRTVARNEASKMARSQTRQGISPEGHVQQGDRPSFVDDPQARVCDADLLVRFLASLPVRHRDILVSSAFAGESDEAIAARIGVSTVTVRTTRVKARARLAQILADAEQANTPTPT